MNDDLTFLASAYLDGDITPDERAQVEADPQALAEVDRLRTVRFLLGDVEQPSISVREAHLAAALDAWGRLPEAERTGVRRDHSMVGLDAAAAAGAASVTSASSRRGDRRGDRRRSTSTRWLSGAAAALVLVLAGGLALQLRTDDGADDTALTDTALTESDAASSGDAVATDDRLASDQADSALAPASEPTNEISAELDTEIAAPPPPGEDAGLVQLQTLRDLADFATAAADAPISPDVPAATSAPTEASGAEADTFVAESGLAVCLGVDVVVGPAVYGDVDVVVGIDESRNLAIAYEAATCNEVARVRLP